ncbi:hypothetical protein I552_10240 [Mycobacterium xenopi 3993]|nr:hypothetical protein I552_10240 [Mycobacterium xenopi 3993]
MQLVAEHQIVYWGQPPVLVADRQPPQFAGTLKPASGHHFALRERGVNVTHRWRYWFSARRSCRRRLMSALR